MYLKTIVPAIDDPRSADTIVLVVPKYDSIPTSEAVDDYLKAIFELSGPSEEVVTGNALAGHLGVRAASVTGMLQINHADPPQRGARAPVNVGS